MNEWKVSGARATLFPASPASFARISVYSLYREVWGSEPDSFQKQENSLMPTVAQGRRGGIVGACVLQPSRLDFSFSSTPPTVPDASGVGVQLIENGRSVWRSFLQLFDALTRGIVEGEVARVAINLQALVVKPNFAEVNQALLEVVPNHYGLRLTDEEDVVFQINKPFISERIPGVKMNAATTWSGARILVLNFSVPASGFVNAAMAGVSENPQTKTFLGASTAFEVNNVPTHNPISSADQASLLREALSWVGRQQAELGLLIEGFKNA
jgi:hypothetical protein